MYPKGAVDCGGKEQEERSPVVVVAVVEQCGDVVPSPAQFVRVMQRPGGPEGIPI